MHARYPARVGRFSLAGKAEMAIPSIKDAQPASTQFACIILSSSMSTNKDGQPEKVARLPSDRPVEGTA